MQTEAATTETVLSDIVEMLDRTDILEDSQEIHPLGGRDATVIVWIAGVQYSLTLTRED